MPVNPIRLATCAAAAALAAGCGGDTVGELVPVSPAVGTYTLRTVNGTPLPASVSTGSRVITFIADTLRLNVGGTYTEFLVTQSAAPGQAPTKRDTAQVTNGQWSADAAAATVGLIPGGSASFTGGNTLTLPGTVTDAATKFSASITQVYQK